MNAVTEKKNEIVEFSEFESRLSEFKKKYVGVIYDLTDEDQNKQARSDRLAIGKVIASLDRKHKEIKAPLKKKVDLIDGERKRIKDDLLEVQNGIKNQIEAYEKKIAEHMEMLQQKVDAIYAIGEFAEFSIPTAAVLFDRLTEVKSIEVDDSYEHRKADATLALVDTARKLEHLYAERLKYEEEQAELERLRKEQEDRERIEREKAIAEAAAKQAKEEVERKAKAEKEAADRRIKEAEMAAAKAESEKKQAELDAAKRERERIEAERLQAEMEAEKLRKEDEAKKAKQAHRAKIHKQAKESFIKAGYSDSDAGKIVTLIKDGKVKNVTITY